MGVWGGLRKGGRRWLSVGNVICDTSIMFGVTDIDHLDSMVADPNRLLLVLKLLFKDECSLRTGTAKAPVSFPSAFLEEDYLGDESKRVDRIQKATEYLDILWMKMTTSTPKLSEKGEEEVATEIYNLGQDVLSRKSKLTAVWSKSDKESQETVSKFMSSQIMVQLLHHMWLDKSSRILFFSESAIHLLFLAIFHLAMYSAETDGEIHIATWLFLIPIFAYTILRKVFTMIDALEKESRLKDKHWWEIFYDNSDNKILAFEWFAIVIFLSLMPAFVAATPVMVLAFPVIYLTSCFLRYCLYNLIALCFQYDDWKVQVKVGDDFGDAVNPDTIPAFWNAAYEFIRPDTGIPQVYSEFLKYIRFSYPVTLIYYCAIVLPIRPMIPGLAFQIITGIFVAWTVMVVFANQGQK